MTGTRKDGAERVQEIFFFEASLMCCLCRAGPQISAPLPGEMGVGILFERVKTLPRLLASASFWE